MLIRSRIPLFIVLFLSCSLAFASVPLGAPRKAPGGKLDLFGCVQSNEYYIVNFAAYQTDPNRAKDDRSILAAECVDLPRIGPTQITLDLLDRDVRRKQVSIKVLRNDGQAILETPMSGVKQGVVSTTVDFRSPGLYEVVLSVNDTDLNVRPEVSALHIPLAVAVARELPPPKNGLSFLFVALAAVALMLAWLLPRFLRPRPDAAEGRAELP